MQLEIKTNWKSRFINLGYTDKQVAELIEYPTHILQYVHEEGYINTDMNCGQIKQVMLGLSNNHLSVSVKEYAKNWYNANQMRSVRILLNIGLNADFISKYINPLEFNYKQCFVLGMVLINSREFNIDIYLDFIRKANNQIDELYRLFNSRVSGVQYYKFYNAEVVKDIISSFDRDLYAAQIQYQLDLMS